MEFKRINIEEFISHAPTNRKTDFFTSKFVSHCKSGGDRFNDHIIGCYLDGDLAGAAVITVQKNKPNVGNLQLLQTFSHHSGKGVATKLFDYTLADAYERGAKYIRASFEPTAVSYYETHGWVSQGLQKTGYTLGMGKLNGPLLKDVDWSRDKVILSAMSRRLVVA